MPEEQHVKSMKLDGPIETRRVIDRDTGEEVVVDDRTFNKARHQEIGEKKGSIGDPPKDPKGEGSDPPKGAGKKDPPK